MKVSETKLNINLPSELINKGMSILSKICKCCNTEKNTSDFYVDGKNPNKYRGSCKVCSKKKNKKRNENHPEKRREQIKKYYNKKLLKNLKPSNIRTKRCSKCEKKLSIEYFHNSKMNLDGYRSICKLCVNLSNKKRYHEDPNYLLRGRMRLLVRRCLHNKNGVSTNKILGYSPLQLREHLESLFTEGMSWTNHGEWHIDHKKPFSWFPKGTNPSIICALSNLKPMWAKDNISKSNKFIG